MAPSEKQTGRHVILSRLSIAVCVLSVVFACISVFIASDLRDTAQAIYDHPYAVSNNARAMRSRLLDMKRFVSTFLIHDDFVSTGATQELFEERYALQQAAIEAIYEHYVGPTSNVDALCDAFSSLIEIQTDAIEYVPAHTDAEIEQYIDSNVYPRYDAVEAKLDTIIAFADREILSMTQQARRSSVAFIGMAVSLALVIVLLTIYSSRANRNSIATLERREHELEDALLVAQRAGNAKKDFLSRMSHEIRTPMNVIIGMATIAGAHIEEPSRVEDCLTKIGYSSRHLLSLVNDVLDMSKIEEGKLQVNREPFELRQLIESMLALITPQAKARRQSFECNIKGDVFETYIGDLMRLDQILINILSNAVKFTPEGGMISLTVEQISVKDEVAHLRFTISDTGIGMSEDFLERIFHPFEQASSATATRYGGTGLGMAITYNLVQLLGGSIRVESTEGVGSTFVVDLPLDIPEELIKPRQWTLESLNVLVVDDDADTCTHASLLLKRMGIQASWVQSGYEAIQRVFEAHDADQDYDVCLVDWKMPEMDGVEVTRRIRERLGPETIIIIISAYDWSVIEEEARKAGANAFISKPLFESTLYNVLQSIYGPPDVTSARQRMQVRSYQGKRFLLVEDNALNREIAVELLRETQAEVRCAVNGQEAVEQFLGAPQGYYDAILMDIQMPVMDGYEATSLIRKADHPDSRSIPIFAMTANAFQEDVQQCLDAGMTGHVAKPIELEVLFKQLDSLL